MSKAQQRRLKRRLLVCGLALAVSVAAAILLVVSANAQRAHQQAERDVAASAAQAAAESEAAAQAAAEEAARAEEEAQQQRADQVAAATAAHEAAQYGDKLGRIWVEGTNVDCGLYLGDDEAEFSRGAGCRAESDCVLPGENGTVFIGAHTGTYFADLGSCQIGAIIHLDTDWGDFAYQITDMQVILETDIDKVRWGASEPSCILYTCYPFGILTHTTQRYAVYAAPVNADEYGVIPDAASDSAS
ncbi:MAG: class D sortase [Subdoligranulum variabile]|uniref:class D sortase n=1 Tax=Gemmiger sp. TaxID=2049027 RepID=UPI002A82A810|nr:class D sortase [Gemmiger sp.]MCI6141267.1 class D sortase [Subdoligranulum variabile]MCI6385001.1 class D sortase [Subdoligranulum variabile]MDD6424865.1 class D sortase [Subdoligranulum variabile]MDD6610303.1 class D sortase [Subdoligranulum variabile]MDD7638638.1 class D sortase [Subdoligranulum variabile]